MSTTNWKIFFLILSAIGIGISSLAIIDGLTPKPTDGLIWRLGHDRVIVEGVLPRGPGFKAGVKVGDVILGINHNLVRNPLEAASILMDLSPGIRVPYLIQRDDEILTLNLTPTPYRTGDYRLLYNALVGIVFLGVGLYTFLKRPALLSARLFLMLDLCFLLVLTCSFRGSPYYWIDLIVQNAARWGLTFLGPLFLHFFLIFPSDKKFLKTYSWIIPIFYIIPLIQHLLFTLSQFFTFTPAQFFGAAAESREIFGIHLELWVLLILYLAGGALALFNSYLRTADPLGRRQIKMILWGTFIGLCPFIVLSIMGAGILGRRELFSIGVLPLMAIPLSFAYSIIRYRLLEINIIIKRSLLYSLLTGLFIGIYIIIVNGIGGWVERVSPFGGSIFGILFVLLIAVSFEPTRARLQKFVNRLFFRSDYNRQTTLTRLTDSLRTFSEMEELARATLRTIDEIFHPLQLSLSVISDRPGGIEVSQFRFDRGVIKKNVYSLGESAPGINPSIRMADNMDGNKRRGNLYVGGIHSDPSRRPPERLELPIFSHQKMVGLLSLNAKESSEPYTLAELEALEGFADQAGLAIENIQLIKSIFEANQRLFEAEKLMSLGQLASGVAHEIRNPLSSIKMNIQGLARNLQPDQINERRLQIIQKEIDHLDHIVHDVLIYARPSRLKIESVNAREVLLNTLELLSPQLKEKNHKIILDVPDQLPAVAADRDKLHQVCKNLIVNACEAMETNGKLEIGCQTFHTHIEIVFADDGPGIPDTNINSIFNPFFTTKADGTGLGLANARKFIQEMDGTIEVKSPSGAGAEFTVTLPLYIEQARE